MEYGPKGFIEEVGDALGIAKMRTSGDLRRFKEFLSNTGAKETGAWRGSIPQH